MKLHASLTAISLIAALPLTALAAQDNAAWPYPADIPALTKQGEAVKAAQSGAARYFQVNKATDGTVSPDGKMIAYATSKTGQPQLWSAPSTGGAPTQLTDGSGVSSFFWMPDSSGLVYLSDIDGDELPAISYVSADGKTKRPLVSGGDAFKIFGDFASDGKTAIFSTTKRNGDDYDLAFLDIETGKTREAYRGKFEWTAAAWQPNGDYIVVRETRGEDAHDLYLFNAKTKTMITLYTPKVAAEFDQINWRADGRGFYMATNLGREFKALGYYDLATGEMTLLETPEADIEAVSLGAGDRFIAWSVNDGGYSKLHVRDLTNNSPVELPEVPAGVYDIEIADAAPIMQITISSPQIPSDVWTYDFSSGALVRATRSSAAGLDLSDMVMPQSLRFKARDGAMLQGLLYTPRKAAAAKAGKPPVIISLHGGPSEQALPVFDGTLQYLVAQGYAVFDLNFRGSLGFGKSFARSDNQQNRFGAVNDVADALAWLKDSGRVDAQRAGVIGSSYGGYLVNAVLGVYPDLFQAGVSHAGVSDWVRALEGASPSLKASDRLEYGDISDPQVRAFHAKISPLANADKITAPILVLHGAQDPRDPVSEADQLVKAVRDAGGSAAYIRFPDEGHYIKKTRNKDYALQRIGAFFDTHLKPDSAVDTAAATLVSTPQNGVAETAAVAEPEAEETKVAQPVAAQTPTVNAKAVAETAAAAAVDAAELQGSTKEEIASKQLNRPPQKPILQKDKDRENAAEKSTARALAATAAAAVVAAEETPAQQAQAAQAAQPAPAQEDEALAKQLETLQQEALDLEAEREAKRAAQEVQKAIEAAQLKAKEAADAAAAAQEALATQQTALKAATEKADGVQKQLNRVDAQIAKTQAQTLEAKDALAKAQAALQSGAADLEAAQAQKQEAQAALKTARQAKAEQAAALAQAKAKAEQAQRAEQAANAALEALKGEPKQDAAGEKGLLEKASDIVKSVVDKVTGEAP